MGGGVLNCWAKNQKSVAPPSWEGELFSATMSGTRSLEIQSELKDLAYSCSITVGKDSQRVFSITSPWSQRCVETCRTERTLAARGSADKKLELEKVHTASKPADACTKALPGDKVRELCRLARVYVCYSEEAMNNDPWRMVLDPVGRIVPTGEIRPDLRR